MKLGIRSLKYVPLSKVNDYSALPSGSSLPMSNYFSEDPVEMPFTPETADLSEEWHYDENGKYSEFSFSGSVRTDKETHRSLLENLAGKKAVFVIESIEGTVYIIGSRDFVPTFTFTDILSGQSSSEFTIKIENRSLHGVLFASA
jgi:hypothetical protein